MSGDALKDDKSYTIFRCKFCSKIFRERQLLIDHKGEQHFDALLKEHCEKLVAEGKPVPEEYQQRLKELEKADQDSSADEDEDDQEAPSDKSGSDLSDDEIADEEDELESSAAAEDESEEAEESQSDGSSDSSERTRRGNKLDGGLRRRSSRRLSQCSKNSSDRRPTTRTRIRKAGSDDESGTESEGEVEANRKRGLRQLPKRPNYKLPDDSDPSAESNDESVIGKPERRATRSVNNVEKQKKTSKNHSKNQMNGARTPERTAKNDQELEAKISRRVRECNNNNKGTRKRNGIKEATQDKSTRSEPMWDEDETDTICDTNLIGEKSQLKSRTTDIAVQTQSFSHARSVQTEVNTRTVSTKTCSYVANWSQDLGVQVNPTYADQGSQISRNTSEVGTVMDSEDRRQNLKDCSSETDRCEVLDAALDPVDFGIVPNTTDTACGSDQEMKTFADAECDGVEAPDVISIGCGTDRPSMTEVACGKDHALTCMVDAQCAAAVIPPGTSVACGSDASQIWDRHHVGRATNPCPTVIRKEVEIQTDAMTQDQTKNIAVGIVQKIKPEAHVIQPQLLFKKRPSRQIVLDQTRPNFNDILATIEQDMKPSVRGFDESPIPLFPSLPPVQLFDTPTRRSSIPKDEYHCCVCGAPPMKTIYDLDQHLKSTHLLYSLKIFGCYKCRNNFSEPDSLKRHLEKAHMLVGLDVQKGMKHFKANCEACSKRLNYDRYIGHIRSVHLSGSTSEAQQLQPKFEFNCDTCSEVFTTNEALLEHTAIHSRTRTRLECDKCTKTFACQTGLKCHTAVDHHVPAQPRRKMRRTRDDSLSSTATSIGGLGRASVLSAGSYSNDIEGTTVRNIKPEPSDPNPISDTACRSAIKERQKAAPPPPATIKAPKTATRLSPRCRSVSATSASRSTTPSVNAVTPSKSSQTPRRRTSGKTPSLTPSTSEADTTSIKSEVLLTSDSQRTPKRKLNFCNRSSASGSPTKKRLPPCGSRSSDRLSRAVKSLRRKSAPKVKENQ